MFRDNLDQVANEGRLITVRDRRIRLYEEGTGPTAVVIVTGAGDCADSWLPIRHHLASSYRIISYDRAAIGEAQDVAPATVDRYLTELGAVVNTASPQDQVVIAGHSLGGLIARLYQYAHPDRVSGLVLLDATPEPVADDRGVQAGFIASSVSARLFKLLTPLGFTRLLLKMRKMPLYPEQPRYKAAVSDAKYERWITMVCNSFGHAAREPNYDLSSRRQGKPRSSWSGTSSPCHWRSLPARPSATSGSTGNAALPGCRRIISSPSPVPGHITSTCGTPTS